MYELASQAFITVLVIINPLILVAVFSDLTLNHSDEEKRKIAKKSCLIGSLVLSFFAFFGDDILKAIGIDESSFRIAGGILLMMVGIDMVMSKKEKKTSESSDSENQNDVSVFPLAIPLIAGPGTMTASLIFTHQASLLGFSPQLMVVASILMVVLISYFVMRYGARLVHIAGRSAINVLIRVFGIILVAIGVQSIFNGITICVKGLKILSN
jgi:multiple antibiotic resistance protein